MCWSRIQILLALAAIAGIGYCVFQYYDQAAKTGKNKDDALLTCDPSSLVSRLRLVSSTEPLFV